MGKNKEIKPYFILSGLNLNDNNRGTAALGYGAFSFLMEKGYLHDGQELVTIKYVRNPFKLHTEIEKLNIQGRIWIKRTIYLWSIHRHLLRKYHFIIPGMALSRLIKKIDFVAAINGGDGFSDIYNTDTFLRRLPDILFAMNTGIPVIQLPQTMGPFEQKENYDLAVKILRYSKAVYVRDKKYVDELDKLGINYEVTKDLSAFMKPEPWDIDIMPNSVGINVSGLCYSNTFRALSWQFNAYPLLIKKLIEHFQEMGIHVYLIPHSYRYGNPETSNDDMVACKSAYESLTNVQGVTFIDADLISPKVKYVISKMSFFIGARMHANFAAIYTNVPVFGLAYSYKFAGAFDANGLNAKEQTVMINNLKEDEIDGVIDKIDKFYKKTRQETYIGKI